MCNRVCNRVCNQVCNCVCNPRLGPVGLTGLLGSWKRHGAVRSSRPTAQPDAYPHTHTQAYPQYHTQHYTARPPTVRSRSLEPSTARPARCVRTPGGRSKRESRRRPPRRPPATLEPRSSTTSPLAPRAGPEPRNAWGRVQRPSRGPGPATRTSWSGPTPIRASRAGRRGRQPPPPCRRRPHSRACRVAGVSSPVRYRTRLAAHHGRLRCSGHPAWRLCPVHWPGSALA